MTSLSIFFFTCVITAFKNFNYGLGSCCSQCCITEAFLFSVGFAGGVLRARLMMEKNDEENTIIS